MNQDRIPSPPLLLTIQEAAKSLAMSRSKVYNMVDTGEMPCVRIGRSVRIETRAVEEFIEANRA